MCKRFSSVFGCIPLCTKIVYASYLLALLFMALCHVLFIVASFQGVQNLTLSYFFFTFGLIGILLVDVISAWGVWRLFVCHKKAGFWIAILSPCLNLMLLFAVIGLFSHDSEGTLAHPTANDIFNDYVFPLLGAVLGLLCSYLFIGILWFSLYFKKKGVAFITLLNNDRLILPLSTLRLLPIFIFCVFFILHSLIHLTDVLCIMYDSK